MIEYAIPLFIVLCIVASNREALLSGLVVAANFCVNEVYVRTTGHHDAWLFFTLTDGLSAAALVAPWHRLPDFGRVGAAVGAIYLTQVLIHWAHWLAGASAPYTYWQTLTAMAFVQLIILTVGGVNGMGRPVRWSRRLWPVFPLSDTLARGQAERGKGE